MLDAKNQTALGNAFCGAVKALQAAAADQGVSVQNFIRPQCTEAALNRLVDSVREVWPGRFSASYARTRVKDLASELASEPLGQETKLRFAALLAELECFKERKLCTASVEGVTLASDDPVEFGPFVLRRATLGLDRVHTLINEMVGRLSYTEEEQAGLAAHMRRHAEESLAGVMLEFEVIADAEQAHAVFIEKATMLTDLLQMSTTIAEWCRSARVALRGHVHTGTYSAWVLPLDPGNWYQPNKRTGASGSLCLSEGNLFLLRRAGVMRLAEALGREATPLEGALLRAVHWYAQATLQEQVGQDTLCLVVCLEAVLALSSGRAMAESVALLVGATPFERKRLYTLVQEAYAVRNLVVHEGSASHGFSGQEEFRRVARDFITKCIALCDELTTPRDLTRRVGELRFS